MDISLLSDPFLEGDDMVTLLGIEGVLDRKESSEMFEAYHLAKDCLLNDQASMMAMRRGDVASRATAEAAMATGAGRAAGLLSQAGADGFTRARTSAVHPRTTAGCSELAFPSPIAITPLPQHHLRYLSNFRSPITPLKTGFHPPVTRIENRAKQPFDSSGKEAFNPCIRPKPATSTAGIDSSRQPDFYSYCREQRQQSTGFCPLPTFRLDENVNVAKEELEQCLRDASSLSGSAITAVERRNASLQAVGVPSSRKSDISPGKRTKEVPAIAPKHQPRLVEESEHLSEVVEAAADVKKPPSGRSSLRKRPRAAEVHNLSERKRRDKINLKMKALQELIPNANKTDKASILDEAIEYMKMLQAQVQFMSLRTGVVVPQLMIPPGMHCHPPQEMLVFPHNSMGMETGMVMADDCAGDDTCPPVVSLPCLRGYSLPKPSCHTSKFQSTSSCSVIDEARDDLQNSHLSELNHAIPAQQQQHPFQFRMQSNAEMYSSFIQLQHLAQENGVS